MAGSWPSPCSPCTSNTVLTSSTQYPGKVWAIFMGWKDYLIIALVITRNENIRMKKNCSESQKGLEWPCSGGLTCVDEKLVGDSRMINIMNGSCKNGSQDFQVCEDCLWGQKSPLTLQPMYLSPSSVSSASRTTRHSCWERHCWFIQ